MPDSFEVLSSIEVGGVQKLTTRAISLSDLTDSILSLAVRPVRGELTQRKVG